MNGDPSCCQVTTIMTAKIAPHWEDSHGTCGRPISPR